MLMILVVEEHKAIDKAIKLKQGGEMVHSGNLDHAVIAITFGIRQLLVVFFGCEWEDTELTEKYYNPPL